MARPFQEAPDREADGSTPVDAPPGSVRSSRTDRRRACILSYLADMPGTVATQSELVAAVLAAERPAAGEADEPPEAAVELDLHHNRLPRLDDAGLLEYDWQCGTVRYDGPTR